MGMSLAFGPKLAVLLALAGVLGIEDATAAPKGRASIAITRTDDFLYLAAPAAIEINGAKVASLGRGESYKGEIAPGPIAITVSTWSSPGSSSIRFTAAPGKTYRMTVGPRGKNFAATMVGGLVGAAIEGGGAFEIVPAP
jgi:hypothetical protein